MERMKEEKGRNILILSQLFSILYVEMTPQGDILRDVAKFWMHLEEIQDNSFSGPVCEGATVWDV